MSRPPKLATTTFGKGSAAKQDAIRKGKVAASKAKLDALKARQAGLCASCHERPWTPGYGDYCQTCGEDEALSGGPAPKALGPLIDADGEGWCRSCWQRQAEPGEPYCGPCGDAHEALEAFPLRFGPAAPGSGAPATGSLPPPTNRG